MLILKGLVISERDVGETGKAVTILTAELGCIDVYVRGGRKSKKSISSTQLFCYAEYSLESKTDAKNITHYYYNSSEPIRLFYDIRLDAKKTALACYFAELLRFSCESAENAGEILRLTLNTLHFLDKGERDMELLRSIFELRLACETGYRPDLIGCHVCYTAEDELMYLNMRTGQLTCSGCAAKGEGAASAVGVPELPGDDIYTAELDSTMLYTIRFIALVEYDRLFSFKLSQRYLVKLSAFTENYIRYQFGKRFDTLRFYKLL
ncbi:MAG: DNA repair protein RecO [Ruminococcus sp.]|nr:DNA repair protein RecO [Ruminococcus sp.]